jgi:hypothetical protein
MHPRVKVLSPLFEYFITGTSTTWKRKQNQPHLPVSHFFYSDREGERERKNCTGIRSERKEETKFVGEERKWRRIKKEKRVVLRERSLRRYYNILANKMWYNNRHEVEEEVFTKLIASFSFFIQQDMCVYVWVCVCRDNNHLSPEIVHGWRETSVTLRETWHEIGQKEIHFILVRCSHSSVDQNSSPFFKKTKQNLLLVVV